MGKLTLIITAVTEKDIIQASDRRLTLPDGTLYDDRANKAVFVQCIDGRFALAYTGLAIIGSQRTDVWVVDVLADAESRLSIEWTVFNAATAIQQSATRAIGLLPLSAVTRGITFVLAGYYGAFQPFLCVISNFEGVKGNQFQQYERNFVSEWLTRPPDHKPKRTALLFHGAKLAIPGTVDRRLKKVRKSTFRQSGAMVEDKLISLIRGASLHETYGKFIGRDCMSMHVPREPGIFPGKYHDHKGGEVHYSPHLVYPGFAVRDLVLGPADEIARLPQNRV